MRIKAQLLLILLIINLKLAVASEFWSFAWFPGIAKLIDSSNGSAGVNQTLKPTIKLKPIVNATPAVKRQTKDDLSNLWDNGEVPAQCEDAILLPLAKLKIVSPEKIIELITAADLEETCQRVNSTVDDVSKAIANCDGFPRHHLYKKLVDGLQKFQGQICAYVKDSAAAQDDLKRRPKKRLVDYKECLNQLQDELHDCEGPADWFEKRNHTIACQFYNDIIDCNYVKAAMLCGKAAGRMVRDFSDKVMRKVLTFKCKRSRSIPHVEHPMIDKSADFEISTGLILFLLGVLYFVFCY